MKVCVFISSLGWGWGPLGWLVPSEIQPLNTRSAGQSITTFVQLMGGATVGQTFLTVLCSMKYGGCSAGHAPPPVPPQSPVSFPPVLLSWYAASPICSSIPLCRQAHHMAHQSTGSCCMLADAHCAFMEFQRRHAWLLQANQPS